MTKPQIAGLLALSAITAPANAALWVDFNSNSQDGGPHNQAGYQPYTEDHEDRPDANGWHTAVYPVNFAFTGAANVSLTPDWPGATGADQDTRQMIDRGAGNDNQWLGTDLDLLTDWIGIDTRNSTTGNAGNAGGGDWSGAGGNPTFMTLTLADLPAGLYNWTSFHHDTEHVHTFFQIELSVDGGMSYVNLGQDFYMTDTSTGGTPDSATDGSPFGPQTGPSALGLPSTVDFDIAATGDDVVVRFAPLAGSIDPAVHNRLWGINGFQLEQIPEPGTGLLALAGLALLARRRRHL